MHESRLPLADSAFFFEVRIILLLAEPFEAVKKPPVILIF